MASGCNYLNISDKCLKIKCVRSFSVIIRDFSESKGYLLSEKRSQKLSGVHDFLSRKNLVSAVGVVWD